MQNTERAAPPLQQNGGVKSSSSVCPLVARQCASNAYRPAQRTLLACHTGSNKRTGIFPSQQQTQEGDEDCYEAAVLLDGVDPARRRAGWSRERDTRRHWHSSRHWHSRNGLGHRCRRRVVRVAGFGKHANLHSYFSKRQYARIIVTQWSAGRARGVCSY